MTLFRTFLNIFDKYFTVYFFCDFPMKKTVFNFCNLSPLLVVFVTRTFASFVYLLHINLKSSMEKLQTKIIIYLSKSQEFVYTYSQDIHIFVTFFLLGSMLSIFIYYFLCFYYHCYASGYLKHHSSVLFVVVVVYLVLVHLLRIV